MLASILSACPAEEPPPFSYFEQVVSPILDQSCVRQTAGCHAAPDETSGPGHLDLSSYDALMRRRDVLLRYGPYPDALLVLKATDPGTLHVDGRAVGSDIRHAGGSIFDVGSDATITLRRWIELGATRDGVPREEAPIDPGPCSTEIVGFTPDAIEAVDTGSEAFEIFRIHANPVLAGRCAGARCHGSAAADLHLTCGESEEELAANFLAASAFVGSSGQASELVLKPLAPSQGGATHFGGTMFEGGDDPGPAALVRFGDAVGPPPPPPALEEFFADFVQPQLVREGCYVLGCHSIPVFNAFKPRGGVSGVFSRATTHRNYLQARAQLALAATDPRASRLVGKNLLEPERFEGGHGITHRGGSLLEDFSDGRSLVPADPSRCPPFDEATALDEPAFCTLVEWWRRERTVEVEAGRVDPGAPDAIVFVRRPPTPRGALEIDAFDPGADLVLARLDTDAAGVPSVREEISLLSACSVGTDVDVRRPDVSYEADRIVFSMRTSAGDTWSIWEVAADGSWCERITGVGERDDAGNGVPIHDVDPAYAPTGEIVFASTRGNLSASNLDYAGPTRTLTLEPNANLYVLDPADGSLRQLTYLLNQELQPALKHNGQIVFLAEKREPGFRQLAGRRINWDGTDYHPQFAQRRSVGFQQQTDMRELLDRNLAVVFSDPGTLFGGGVLGVVNRSLGPDEPGRAATEGAFLHSVAYPGGAPGPTAGPVDGLWRSPAAWTDARVLVSFAPGPFDATDPSARADYDVVLLDRVTGVRTPLAGGVGTFEIEAVPVVRRPERSLFTIGSALQDGGELDSSADDAVVTFLDYPLLATLLHDNLRHGRPIDSEIVGLRILEPVPPPAGATSLDDPAVSPWVVEDDFGRVYSRRRVVGETPLEEDGSVRIRVPGGTPLVYEPIDAAGDAHDGQLEEEQYGRGERINRAVPRRFFNGLCGGCHGSITGRESEIAVNPDILTGASNVLAKDAEPVDLDPPTAERPWR